MPTVGPDPWKKYADFAERMNAAVAAEDWEEVARLTAQEAPEAAKARQVADLIAALWPT